MFSARHPVSHARSPKKVTRPYGQTKQPQFHPRKAFPPPPPTPFDIRGARRAAMHAQNENAAPSPGHPAPPCTPRRRYRAGGEAPPTEPAKPMRFLDPPPRKPHAPPRPVGNQIFIDFPDAAQPFVDELKRTENGRLPLEKVQLALQYLSQMRFGGMTRQAYHEQAALMDAPKDTPERSRHVQMIAAGAAKRREMREAKEKEEQQKRLEAEALREKERKEKARVAKERARHEEEAALRRAAYAIEAERRRQEELAREHAERLRREMEAEQAQLWQRRQEEARRRRQLLEEAERQAQIERIEAMHRERIQRAEAQRREEEERRLRLEALQREREAQLRAEQERAAREAEEAARRAAEEQARLAREEAARQAQAAEEDTARAFCDAYEAKWAQLKTNKELVNIVGFHEFPWPAFILTPTDPAEITLDRVRLFLFHSFRGKCIEGKTPREILKVEVMRWHPDKFNAAICPKVRVEDWERTKEAAGLVARWVTTLMAEL